jgi:hypothetical protein
MHSVQPTVTADSEELLPSVAAFSFRGLDFEEFVGIVHVSCSLDLVLAETA